MYTTNTGMHESAAEVCMTRSITKCTYALTMMQLLEDAGIVTPLRLSTVAVTAPTFIVNLRSQR